MARLSKQQLCVLVLALSLFSDVTAGIDVDLTSTGTWQPLSPRCFQYSSLIFVTDSIKSVVSIIAYDMITYYKGNLSGQIPGELPGPPPNPSITNQGYFWWEAGAMWGSLINYVRKMSFLEFFLIS